MKWISDRVSIKKHSNYTTIVIVPIKNIWTSILLSSWLGMWIMIGIAVVSSFFIFNLNNKEQLILFVFLSFWLYYVIKIGYTYLWIHYGKELVKLDENGINYKRSIFKYGKMHSIFYENVVMIHSHFPKENSFESVWESSPWISGGERISIDTKLKSYKIGRKLKPIEVYPIVDLLKSATKKNLKD
jgi:hypothetical protein